MAHNRSRVDMSELWKRHEKLLKEETIEYEGARLPFALIKSPIYAAARNNRIEWLAEFSGYFKNLAPEHYFKPLLTLVCGEEAYAAIDLRRYDLFDCNVQIDEHQDSHKSLIFSFKYQGLTKQDLPVVSGDYVVFERGSQYLVGKIVTMSDGNLYVVVCVEVPKKRKICFDSKRTQFNIFFVSKGLIFDRYRKAFKSLQQNYKKRCHFVRLRFENKAETVNEQCNTWPKIGIPNGCHDERLTKCNQVQKQAIKNILMAKCRPKPYILWGPPGTGKTLTLIESVIQIHKRNKQLYILVSVNSNNCADNIADRLYQAKCFAPKILLRLVPQSLYKELKESSRLFEYVNSSITSDNKVVVTTNIKAGSIKYQEFDYVFIDEAGHANEPESLVPISKLNPNNGCLVVAGDSKQLGPVVKCTSASDLGLGTSLLQRLLKYNVYRSQDPRFLTFLTESYRCDQRIMEFWDKQFYDNKLKSSQWSPKTPLALLDVFNVKKTPLLFKAVQGEAKQPNNSFSYYNELEARICVDLVMKLRKHVRPDQICVIATYKRQTEQIKKELVARLREFGKQILNERSAGGQDKGWHEFVKMVSEGTKKTRKNKGSERTPRADAYMMNPPLQVDSVDAFQGKEREVVIISTVITPHSGSLKFLNRRNRINVAVSRAKWLVVVVGHPDTLEQGMDWRDYVRCAERI